MSEGEIDTEQSWQAAFMDSSYSPGKERLHAIGAIDLTQGERPVAYLHEFLECRNGKVWPNDRPGLGVVVDETPLTPIGEITTGAPGVTHRRPDGSLTHW